MLGRRERTFCVEGHHYAIVPITGLEPGDDYPYEVALDGERRWPRAGRRTSRRARSGTIDPERPLKIVFGSCRVAVPHEPPWTPQPGRGRARPRGRRAVRARAADDGARPRAEWPHLLLSIGDQVYVDEDAPETREFIRSRRDTSLPPGEEVADFEEYTRLYRESWGDPVIRWLFSTVGVAMIFDDHDVHDDWNTSIAWLEEMRAKPWWEERIESGAVPPTGSTSTSATSRRRSSRENELLPAGAARRDDAGPLLREFAQQGRPREQRQPLELLPRPRPHAAWSCSTRARAACSASARARSSTTRNGSGSTSRRTGDFDHLLLVDTLPFLLIPALHHLEAWNEAVCAGAWGEWAAGLGRAHPARARPRALGRLQRVVPADGAACSREVGSGSAGRRRRRSSRIGGDVHHAYLAEVGFPARRGARERRLPGGLLAVSQRARSRTSAAIVRTAARRGAERVARALARAAGVPDPEICVAAGAAPDLRQPVRDARARRPQRRCCGSSARSAATADNRSIETSLERRLA